MDDVDREAETFEELVATRDGWVPVDVERPVDDVPVLRRLRPVVAPSATTAKLNSPRDLLTAEQQVELDRGLAAIAAARRRGWAASANIVIG